MFPAANRASPSKSRAADRGRQGKADVCRVRSPFGMMEFRKTNWNLVRCVPITGHSHASDRSHWRENPPDERYSGTISLAPRIYEGGGPRSGRGSPPPQRRGKPPQSRLRRASSPRGEAEGASHRSCPRIYEGGGPRSGRGSPPPQRGRPLSAARCASAEFRFPRYPSQKISPFPIWKRGKITSYCQPSMVLNSCMYFPAGTSQLKSCSMSRRTRLSKAGRFSRYRPMQRLMAARKSSPL